MRALSEKVVESIREAHELAEARRWPWKRGETLRRLEGALETVVASGEWLALPRIISLVLDDRVDIATATARAVGKLTSLVAVSDLPVLDCSFRELSPWLNAGLMDWHKLRRDDLDALAALPNGSDIVQLATFHTDGHVRQPALSLLAAASDGAGIAFCLLRLNDWVEPVRVAAAAAVRAQLLAEPSHFVAALPIIDAAKRWGRVQDTELLAEIDSRLRSADAAPALRAGCQDDDRAVRRSCFRRALESDAIDTPDLLSDALRHDDPWIRIWASRYLCEHPADGFDRLVEVLLHDPIGAIRAHAVEVAVARDIPVELEPLLSDGHAVVRAFAQAKLLSDDFDVLARYRALLQSESGKRLGAALIGLAESGSEADAHLVRPFLVHETPRVRRAALHALAALRADDLGDLCLGALRDEHPSLAHAARDLLVARSTVVEVEAIWRAFEATPHTHGKKDALVVIAALDYWWQIGFLLRATAEADAVVRDYALLALSRWLARADRCFTRPSSSARAAVAKALPLADAPAATLAAVGEVMRSRA